jgi:cupin fold WbuC family metalloprotein
MKIISRQLLDQITAEAKDSPRLRKNWNIHPNDEFPAHRLLNAMEPSSYIRPHRHLDQLKDETFMIVRGKLGILIFDDEGRVTEKVLLEAGGENLGADIPSGRFHTAVSFESGTIFFEAKAGPYVPLKEGEKPSWAPEEGSAGAESYLAAMKEEFPA